MKIGGGSRTFLVRRLQSSASLVTGLRLKAVRGEIEVNGQRHAEIILWADTSPETVSLSVLSDAGCELKAWNVWRAGDVVQAWVGNAGIAISEVGSAVTLECSGGGSETDFSALVVQIEPVN